MSDKVSLHIVPVQSPLFELGRLLITSNAIYKVTHDDLMIALARHIRGDWGELDPSDLKCNERALQFGGRLFSAYLSTDQVKFWIITECDRSATTVLLPEDY